MLPPDVLPEDVPTEQVQIPSAAFLDACLARVPLRDLRTRWHTERACSVECPSVSTPSGCRF